LRTGANGSLKIRLSAGIISNLSKLINNAESHHQKANLIKTIKNGSVVVWRHINLQGEYDFSEEVLKNSIEFSLPEILELQVL
jgi:hypothetical protein